MSTQTVLPDGSTESVDPEPGEERVFWDSERLKRRFISSRGRRRAPTEEVVPDDSHWVKIQGAPVEGASVYEWQPPEEEIEEEEPEEGESPGVEGGVQPVKQEEVGPEKPPETETAPPEVPKIQEPSGESETAEKESEKEGPTPGEHGPETPPEMPETRPPTTAHVSLIEETEHAMLFQENGYYTVENTETGETVTLPAGEWEDFSPFFKRGSRME